MPRSNHPRRGGTPVEGDDEDFDLSRVVFGSLHIESRRNGRWNVQPISAASAVKFYRCPGCGLPIGPKVPHTVAWPADGLMGEADDVASRRHWHNHCWKIG